ncbi:MAG: hypothetical protein NVSMB65_07570 [Chloroflexota bacterium]
MYLTPLFLDDDLVVVDKPAGLSTHPTDADGVAGSVIAATRATLAGMDGAHLGVHQRLDRETSGVLLFGRSARADRSLSHAFGSRAARKTYLAAVYGRPPHAEGLVEAALLPPNQEGRVAVARGPGGKEAATAYRVLGTDRRRGISLVEARPLTGRTHQIRVHLAALGCPIAGDPLYDPRGRAAPRLCLHAWQLSLPHPSGGEWLELEAPPPPGFDDLTRLAAAVALTQALAVAPGAAPAQAHAGVPGLEAVLALAVHRRAALAADPGTTAYRVVHGAGDGLPGVIVDRYGEVLWLRSGDGARRFDGPSAVRDHLTRGAASRAGTVQAPGGWDGGAAPPELVVAEEGLLYLVRDGAGLSPALRDVRAWVRRHAPGRTVLNLCASTCTVGVAGMAGGAARVLNLDAARPRLDWGKHNYRLNSLEVDDYDFVDGDALDWLARLGRRRQMFDIVIVDVPGGRMARKGQRSTRRLTRTLAAGGAAVVARGGLLVLCCARDDLSAVEFRRAARAGVADAGRQHVLVATAGAPGVDHPHPAGAESTLNVMVMALG